MSDIVLDFRGKNTGLNFAENVMDNKIVGRMRTGDQKWLPHITGLFPQLP